MGEPKSFIEEQGWSLTEPEEEDAFVLKVDSFCWTLGMAGEAVIFSLYAMCPDFTLPSLPLPPSSPLSLPPPRSSLNTCCSPASPRFLLTAPLPPPTFQGPRFRKDHAWGEVFPVSKPQNALDLLSKVCLRFFWLIGRILSEPLPNICFSFWLWSQRSIQSLEK
jgi:hypothetical protein